MGLKSRLQSCVRWQKSKAARPTAAFSLGAQRGRGTQGERAETVVVDNACLFDNKRKWSTPSQPPPPHTNTHLVAWRCGCCLQEPARTEGRRLSKDQHLLAFIALESLLSSRGSRLGFFAHILFRCQKLFKTSILHALLSDVPALQRLDCLRRNRERLHELGLIQVASSV